MGQYNLTGGIMAKSKTSQRYILKLDANRLRRSKFNINITFAEAIKNKEIISISESEVIRFIEQIIVKNQDVNVFNRKAELVNNIKTETDKKKIDEHKKKLTELLYLQEYITVKFKDKKTFNEINKDGFWVNGSRYIRLLGTSGGIKKNTVVYVKSDIHEQLELRLKNGRKNTKRVPAKLEAYRSLACSSSTPVPSDFKFVVVNDFETTFKTKVTYIDSAIDGEPQIEDIDNYEIKHTDSDGYGLISPKLALIWRKELDGRDGIPTGFCIRNAYTKGMVFTFNIHDFARDVAKTDKIVDIWGDEWNISDIDMIIPKSVFKLADDYNNLQHYLDNCKENGYKFCVTKMITTKNDNVRNLNYQFIQSLDLTDQQIRELIKPTIKEFKDIMSDDYYKSVLFLTGMGVTEDNLAIDNGYVTALQIEKELFNDEFVRSKIHQMLSKKINDAKMGVVATRGNFSVISGDVYGFAESAFGMENPKGLLKSGEFYSNYWNQRGVREVVGMRAPMTVDSNIRKLKLVNNDNTKHWYKYMKNCIIFNAWDATCNALNGADKD